MKKRLIAKSLIGFVVGALVAHAIALLVNYFDSGQYLVCMPTLTEKLGVAGAVVVQSMLAGIFGMVALGGTCLFDIERWSLLRASVAHCALILVTFMIVGLLLHWFSFDIIPILIMTGMIIVTYALIWLIMYVAWKREIRQMNRLAEEYKKNAAADED
ncbi:MAG: DUF3021 domain-containing protein [Clostridiaceae bacterium]|nr:DUF3021 domain-containing protein [Clostridiaceae bacterium]